MEGLGKKLKDARLARNLTLDEAGRMTKIRPGRLEEIENEDFSQFASLAYAKGFLLIYGKFLDVDVSQYLEAFETSESVTVDGYAYLQDNPEPPPSRPAVSRRPRRTSRSRSSGGGGLGGGNRSSFAPLVIGIIVLVVGFIAIRWILELQRLKPRPVNTPTASPSASQTKVVAPRALPAENATPPAVATTTAPPVQPTVAVTTPAPTPAASEPEVRRAEAVHPEDLKAQTNASPSATGPTKVEVRALKKTYVKVTVDDDEESALERWITPADGVVHFQGTHIAVKVLDTTAVEIKKNGKRITKGDANVTID